MIISYENNLLTQRYELFGHGWGIETKESDTEEWVGIRSQILATIYGWA